MALQPGSQCAVLRHGAPRAAPPPPPTAPAGCRRVRAKLALNVAAHDLLMVLSEDAELPWLQAALARAATAPVAAME